MASIDKLEFKGAIGNMPWASITMNEFIDALSKNGWREAPHKGHLYQRLLQRGSSLGIKTPNDFARALRSGTTEDAEDGAKKRVCRGGTCWVIFRDNILITFRHAKE
jgi:hypothetical protein